MRDIKGKAGKCRDEAGAYGDAADSRQSCQLCNQEEARAECRGAQQSSSTREEGHPPLNQKSPLPQPDLWKELVASACI